MDRVSHLPYVYALRAYKSLKAYKYFYDGCVWVFQWSSENQLNLRVLYFCDFVYHSDSPYEVVVSLNEDNGDVHGGQ